MNINTNSNKKFYYGMAIVGFIGLLSLTAAALILFPPVGVPALMATSTALTSAIGSIGLSSSVGGLILGAVGLVISTLSASNVINHFLITRSLRKMSNSHKEELASIQQVQEQTEQDKNELLLNYEKLQILHKQKSQLLNDTTAVKIIDEVQERKIKREKNMDSDTESTDSSTHSNTQYGFTDQSPKSTGAIIPRGKPQPIFTAGNGDNPKSYLNYSKMHESFFKQEQSSERNSSILKVAQV